jgi:hypothetical protein
MTASKARHDVAVADLSLVAQGFQAGAIRRQLVTKVQPFGRIASPSFQRIAGI